MRDNAKKPPIVAIVVALVVVILVVGLIGILRTLTVSGSTTLSDGSRVDIISESLGFGVSSGGQTTEVTAGSYVVEFVGRQVNVNGVEVGTLPDEVTDYRLVVKRGGVKLTSGDEVVAEVD